MPTRFLGEFEQVVLLSVLHLGDDAYGVRIMDDLEQRVGRSVSRGAMYVTLDRLADKGYLASHTADPTPERGGRGKRYVRVTPAGVTALAESRRMLQTLWEGLGPVLDRVP